MNKILLTGASGFIGRNLIKCLDKYEVIAIFNKNNNIKPQKNLNIINLDLNNYFSLKDLIEKEKPKILIHLAWITDNKTYINSEENFKYLSISKNIIDLFMNNGGEYIIIAGSCLEDYHNNTLYSETKSNLRNYCFSNYKEIAWLKIFFPFGPDDKKEKFINSVIISALENKNFTINSPENIIDYIYIDDLNREIINILENKEKGVFELGSGIGYKLLDIANEIFNIINPDSKIIYNKFSTEKKIIIAKPRKLINFLFKDRLIEMISLMKLNIIDNK